MKIAVSRLLVSVALVLASVGSSSAATITVAPSSAVVGTTAPGLIGGVYHDGSNQPLTGNASTELPALEAIIAGGPNDTYNAQYLNYTGNDTAATNSFLGSDSNGTAASDSSAIHTTIFDARGVVNVTAPGTYTFTAGNSDDASYILIAGQTVAADPGSHGGQTASGTATFSAAGNYPIEILYVNQDYNGGTGGATFQYSSDFSAAGSLHFELLHEVPEPSSIVALVGLCGMGLIGLVRYRRRAASHAAG